MDKRANFCNVWKGALIFNIKIGMQWFLVNQRYLVIHGWQIIILHTGLDMGICWPKVSQIIYWTRVGKGKKVFKRLYIGPSVPGCQENILAWWQMLQNYHWLVLYMTLIVVVHQRSYKIYEYEKKKRRLNISSYFDIDVFEAMKLLTTLCCVRKYINAEAYQTF